MKRIIEGIPGEKSPVWVQDRGGSEMRLRGHILIEDLGGVITSISSRTGANGPLNPVTQYMLSEAVHHLAERLTDDLLTEGSGPNGAPRILSSALGHQPFVESVLRMSQHQMLRRWPTATDWYADVIAYLMRPGRSAPRPEDLRTTFMTASTSNLGEFVRAFAYRRYTYTNSPKLVQLAEAIQCLWPEYPPVRAAIEERMRSLRELYAPLYAAALHSYGLHPRPGIDLASVAWMFTSLQQRESLDSFAGITTTFRAPDGQEWPLASWSVVQVMAGICTDEDGRTLGPFELAERMPVRPFVMDAIA
ncbi:MAG: hypothetical protein QM708_07800 [Propioniciclava sp.]|uniref:hypothetical protein n=1 Tax=Propioniciclava sp. TaxID=2038686 RepID=UPI0039E3EE61